MLHSLTGLLRDEIGVKGIELAPHDLPVQPGAALSGVPDTPLVDAGRRLEALAEWMTQTVSLLFARITGMGPDPAPMALAIKVEVPWDRGNILHQCTLDLLDEDGGPVVLPSADGREEPLRINASFETGRPPGLRAGTPLDVTLAVNLAPIQLEPGRRYVWRFRVDGYKEEWTVGFNVRTS